MICQSKSRKGIFVVKPQIRLILILLQMKTGAQKKYACFHFQFLKTIVSRYYRPVYNP